jgi:acetyltransferase-like isoleucine patch superfamily enzyme
MPSQAGTRGEPIITIGDRCTLGKGIGIVAHERLEIGDDIWTGHYVYVTDQNHGYEDIDLPIGVQMWKNEPVSIGDGSWLGHGAIVLPGSRLGRHVVVAAGAVVAGLHVPDNAVVAGVPARVVRKYVAGKGWVPVPRDA